MIRSKRRRRGMRNSKITVLVTSFLIVFLTVGYASVNQQLSLIGRGQISEDNNLSRKYSLGEEVYFDPYKGYRCEKENVWTKENQNATCYKWNILYDKSDTVEMMVDHNLGEFVAWDLSDQSSTGPKEVMVELKRITDEFKNVTTLTSSDNKKVTTQGGASYIIPYNGYKGRLIGIDEIIAIDNIQNWTGLGDYIPLNTKWLYQNLDKPTGYWTDTAYGKDSFINTAVWNVYNNGTLHSGYSKHDYIYQVSPIIRVHKKFL